MMMKLYIRGLVDEASKYLNQGNERYPDSNN